MLVILALSGCETLEKNASDALSTIGGSAGRSAGS